MSAPATVVMYATAWCPYCQRARALFASKGVRYTEINVEATPGARDEMRARSVRSSVPQIFIDERHIGGFDETQALDEQGKLDPLLAGTASA